VWMRNEKIVRDNMRGGDWEREWLLDGMKYMKYK
jgi:hypothetical protein